jgi:hypothetical protein
MRRGDLAVLSSRRRPEPGSDITPQGDRSRGAYTWIRSNILGLVAIFIALTGSAIASQIAT